jgi:hypothetical protein
VTRYGDALTLPQTARATAWADGLQLEGASALAGYDHPHFGRFPAATTAATARAASVREPAWSPELMADCY